MNTIDSTNRKTNSLIKGIADDKKNILEHFRNGGTVTELNDRGIYFCNPL